ncbi:MAG: mevalonate kinase [Anaerolineae bacterium]|nr:mevalonate kinase [Anaerolineae bacterium]
MNAEHIERSASGKIILCGEHSVVYGRPAIAVPVSTMRAYARIDPAPTGSGLQIHALDLQQKLTLKDAGNEHPLALGTRLVLEHLMATEPDAILTLRSDLPIASGLGSGASVAAAAARALGAALGTELSPDVISQIAYEVEKIHHGNPSGIDNTVIAWEKPVYFVRGTAPETFSIHTPFKLLIADSGIASSTRAAVAEVRGRWEAAPGYYNVVFNCIGAISKAAREAVEQGAIQTLGTLMNENHELLVKMGVSLPQLDNLTQAARRAGALGAKMTGSGHGGNIIALVEDTTTAAVKAALSSAGAPHIWETIVGQPDG